MPQSLCAQQLIPFRDFLVPQVAVGGNYATRIVLTNRGSIGFDGTVTFARGSNLPFPVRINASVASSVFDFDVRPGETRVFDISADGAVQAGFAYFAARDNTALRELRSTLELSVVYRVLDGSIARDTVGVIPTAEMQRFLLHFERSASVDGGLALVNLDRNRDVGITLRLYDQEGSLRDTRALTLTPFSHVAQFIPEWMNVPPAFTGRAEVEATGPVGAVALRSEDGQFSALPVIPVTEIWDLTVQAGTTRQFRVNSAREGFHHTALITFLFGSLANQEIYIGSGRLLDKEWTLSFRSSSPSLNKTINYHLVSPNFGVSSNTFSGVVVYYNDGEQFITGTFTAQNVN